MILTDDMLSREPATKATFAEALEIIQQLEIELNNASSGIGLAAPQLGIDKAVAIIRVPNLLNGNIIDPTEPVISVNLVNPILIEGDGNIFFDEGCLSFPGKTTKTIRFEQIVLETDIDDYSAYAGRLNKLRLNNDFGLAGSTNQTRKMMFGANESDIDLLTCVCVQHEFSHLLGLTMFDFNPIEIGRNEQCPCGSGRKNKKCHEIKNFNQNLNKLFDPQYK